ncbi:SpoIIE family protein phosphatase [Streptomyces qinzhouensis]|uniref:SpoIIE family protein phosphatase n=1 Tax=Streptomyces qinzhouensis TaxID=2599401 RepID=A0A5B8JI89_9ACTN|nr:SpoIIE family protein phosphatase [Streptomyces qinzhouensis]QDY81327.1 SpoIIE family protein phosphatase [Streptomyces qinzhouensis]
MRSVAGQVFLLQVVIVILLVAAGMVALVLQSHSDSEREATRRSLAVAETFANAPGIEAALKSPDPTAALQPRAETARKLSGVDFVVVLDPGGKRLTAPEPGLIGKQFHGETAPALHGGVVEEQVGGPLGPLVQATVPVHGADGSVIGLVSAGVTLERVSGVVEEQFPLLFGVAGGVLLLATVGTALVTGRLRRQTHGLGPEEMTRMYEHHDAVLHAVREGVLILDGDRRLLLVNDEARRLLGLPAEVEGRTVDELDLDPHTARLLSSGRIASDEVYRVGRRLLAVNQRATDQDGGPPGTVATIRDTTELAALSGRVDVAQQRLRLLYDAGEKIGTTLDVVRTCEELAEFAAARFADYATVDLVETVLRGEEPTVTGAGADMRRTAYSGPRNDTALFALGTTIRFLPDTPMGAGLGKGEGVLEPDLAAYTGWEQQSQGRARRLVEAGFHSMIAVPLRARGAILGVAMFWRSDRPEPFDEEDRSLAEELVARAAVSVDNARRYSREHTMAVTLQRSLLPRGLPEQSALETAFRYRPAQAGLGGLGGVGGDWFDIIALPGSRVALVVGDVVGHGLHAAATMGRLRTAVHNFSTLDLPPDELLWHLDELVVRIDQEDSEAEAAAEAGVTGATCLIAIYDPATGVCTMARAGHVQPVIVHPDGTAAFANVPGGPPLGLGGMPFETLELRLPEGTTLVLYTDGLVEDRDRDMDDGLMLLRSTLSGHGGRTPDETCEAVLRALLPENPRDDIALLVGRTKVLDASRVAEWDVPSDPSAVGEVRARVAGTLKEWDLEDEAFTTELILSELVTNAIRYAVGPIRVRLIRDRALICEVSDHSSTSPHLRQAASTDEGGRGLFLVAQFADRWGTRYTPGGKVIWTEQPLAGR